MSNNILSRFFLTTYNALSIIRYTSRNTFDVNRLLFDETRRIEQQ